MSAEPAVPVITFLSDYGQCDEFVGVCHAVIARRCPRARIIDLVHGVPRHDIRAGALALRAALPYAPPGVHLAVGDPGVGGERRAVALRVAQDERILVGPDNGLLTVAAEALGGVVEAVDIGDSPECLRPISATFHGRDVFAPVAAALADGVALAALGEPIEEALGPALAQADYLTFTSSSTVRFFLSSAQPGPHTRIVSIGPVTSATLREHGLTPDVEASRHDIDGLLEAIVADRTAQGGRR